MNVSKLEVVYSPKQDHLLYTPVVLTAKLLAKDNPNLITIRSSEQRVNNTSAGVDVLVDGKPVAVQLRPFSVCKLLLHATSQPSALYSSADLLQIDYLIDQIEITANDHLDDLLAKLDAQLLNRKYLVGSAGLTLADLFLWSKLAYLEGDRLSKFDKLKKWFNRLENDLRAALSLLTQYTPKKIISNAPRPAKSKEIRETTAAGRKEEGKYVDLPNAEHGKVVVRFPPEASGYLHIGHAKAALLNQFYQQKFEGKLIFRFDDTNPEKEKEDFEEVIREDVASLKIKPDICSYTSDYFDLYQEKCDWLIKQGKAYCDDTPQEQMKEERVNRVESKNRQNSIEKNVEMWNEMLKGSEYGQRCCVRAKIDMNSDNGCLRDPILYRCKVDTPHPRTGTKYKAYPTYDFACPIIDSHEGVTHSLRTTEYADRDEQFYWICDALQIRKPIVYSYSRLNLTHTVLSKRKLTWFVENKLVSGWDDPRMPTVRGILRRGLTIEGLKEFIIAQGSSRAIVVMEWDKIWNFNRKIIDPQAIRYMGLEKANAVKVNVENVDIAELEIPCHPKNTELGKRKMKVSKQLLLDQTDAVLIKENEFVTFMNLGNVMINKVIKDASGVVKEINGRYEPDSKDFKKTLKVSWLDSTNVVNARCCYYENLIEKPILDKDNDKFEDFINRESEIIVDFLVEKSLSELKKGDIIQIVRKGFFICDEPYDQKALAHTSLDSKIVLFSIADGTTDLVNYPKVVQDAKIRLREKIASFAASKPSNKELQANKELQVNKCTVNTPDDLQALITQQGDKVRALKEAKKSKAETAPEIDKLLKLKADYEKLTGQKWAPPAKASNSTAPASSTAAAPAPAPSSNAADDLLIKIQEQGDKIRTMKGEKKSKDELQPEINQLLKLKADFEKVAGKKWDQSLKPSTATPATPATPVTSAASSVQPAANGVDELDRKITEQGDKIRTMKAAKKSKDELQPEINQLLKLKADYEKLAGKPWTAPTQAQPTPSQKAPSKEKPAEKPKQEKPKQEKAKQEKPNQQRSNDGDKKDGDKKKKETKLSMQTKKSENFSDWYTEVITKSGMIDYYDISGCYVLWEWSFGIWEKITGYLDGKFKQEGVKNVGFPLFVSKRSLEVEKNHIADFAPEVAWVTKSGSSDMQEPIAIRPTSETVMYPYFAKRIKSHRDLPVKVNQWCNVVRWEFKDPTPFLRTREFYWQEGHTAHATSEDAIKEVRQILDHYASAYEYLLAIPVIKGKKTEKEKFPGGDMTTTIEGFISENGRGIQAATSHFLGQNFSKMFNIVFADDAGKKEFAYQNSWGFTTRSIGVMVMEHSDDKGLVLPPRVAPIQVIIIPCGVTKNHTEADKQRLFDACKTLESELVANGVLAELDATEHNTVGFKFSHYELKGVPLRVEIGFKDLEKSEFVAIRRDTFEKKPLKLADATSSIKQLLDDIQNNLFTSAKRKRDDRLKLLDSSMDEFNKHLNAKCLVMVPFCGDPNCEEKIKEKTTSKDASGSLIMGAKSLCIPFDQPKQLASTTKCINDECKLKPQYYVLFGRSY